jgi:hypothetical protein
VKQTYEVYKPKPETLAIIKDLNGVVTQYIRSGYSLTVRQLYYQMIARDLFPDTWIDPETGTKNNQANYKKLVALLGKARMGGLVDWDAIEDRGRNLVKPSSWDSPQQIMSAVANQYKINLWDTQPYYIQVWVEKDALSGVLERACGPLRVPWMACKGYMSLSEIRAQGRLLKQEARSKDICIIHLGDHDPSGIAMTQDVMERLSIFAEQPIEVVRIALNMDQVELYNPPENPAKETDSRFAAYEREFGNLSWELDALTPEVLNTLITDAVLERRDEDAWAEALADEQQQTRELRAASNNWSKVVAYMQAEELIEEDDDE